MARPSNTPPKPVSLSEAATLLGVHRNTVKSWLDRGCTALRAADAARGIDWQLSLADILAWRESQAVAAVEQATGPAADVVDLDEARRRKVLAEAELAEYELAQVRGSVVAVSDIAARVTSEYAEVRARLLSIPARLAQRLAVETDASAIERAIKAEVTAALEELTGDRHGAFT